MSVCSHEAITMKPDALGFFYPEADADKCVDCGLCDSVCSFVIPPERAEGFPESYLVRHKEVSEVSKSKSGAAFVALSDVILNDGGSVYGARLNADYLVVHDSATTPTGRDSFRGSKYIQSDLRGMFGKVRSDLLEGRKVLFSGTPCQVAGLKSFISPRLSGNLYLVDVLCHGVASPAVWADYLKRIEKRKGKAISRCIPRNPEFGWENCVDSFILDDGTQYDSDYFSGYVYHKWITQRWSCGACPFTSLNRVSDVTLGDAWGAGRIAPDFDRDNAGSSLVLINSKKGRSLFVSAEGSMLTVPIDIREMMQPVMQHPTPLHPKRQAFEDTYAACGFKYSRLIYLNDTYTSAKSAFLRSLRKIKRILVK